jgi:flagellar motor switch protein FliG
MAETAVQQIKGKQKAALLLMGLDAPTAGELLKGLDTQTVQELALELAVLDASGYRDSIESIEIAADFCNNLRGGETPQFKNFLDEMLRNAVGGDKAKQIETEIGNLLHRRDPFMRVRSVDSKVLTKAIENEHPQAIGVILAELDAKKSSEVLSLLGEGVRLSVISRMTGKENVGIEAKLRIASMVNERLKAMSKPEAVAAAAATEAPDQSLRKVAVILRNLAKEVRDSLINAIKEKDTEAADKVAELMIIWEDIVFVTDRSLQQALRGIDAKKFALALNNADQAIQKKIRSNISERANSMIDEEISLMASPKKEDIATSREDIVKILRELNIKGELLFIES